MELLIEQDTSMLVPDGASYTIVFSNKLFVEDMRYRPVGINAAPMANITTMIFRGVITGLHPGSRCCQYALSFGLLLVVLMSNYAPAEALEGQGPN